jgi:hypothetical protein
VRVLNNTANTTTNSNSNNTTEILINDVNDIGAFSLDADIKYDTDIHVEREFSQYDFIKDIKIPKDLDQLSRYVVYTKDDRLRDEDYQNAPYNVLHDYVVCYGNQSDGEVLKDIIVAFSLDFNPLRDYYVMETDTINISRINNTDLKIFKYDDMYMVTFQYQNLNFDIETSGITENQLIELLESIIK